MTLTEKAIRDFCGHHADWWPSITQVQEMLALAQPPEARNFCPRCGKRLHGMAFAAGGIHTCTPPRGLEMT
jgi:hypothetical protein